jgi:hypothetical protein
MGEKDRARTCRVFIQGERGEEWAGEANQRRVFLRAGGGRRSGLSANPGARSDPNETAGSGMSKGIAQFDSGVSSLTGVGTGKIPEY